MSGCPTVGTPSLAKRGVELDRSPKEPYGRGPSEEGHAMAFVQTISFKSSQIDEMQKLMDEWGEQQGTAQTPGFRGSKVLKDRDNENTFLVVAEFESYEAAMENSGRPETDAFAKRMAEMTDGSPAFANFDVIHEDTP
jgi:quinol monooxygenase YgiN